jgi:hypothetical protein
VKESSTEKLANADCNPRLAVSGIAIFLFTLSCREFDIYTVSIIFLAQSRF